MTKLREHRPIRPGRAYAPYRPTQPGQATPFSSGAVRSAADCSHPRARGSEKAPIRVDAYGIGPLTHIVAEPGQAAAFQLFDQQYFVILDLEFSGGDPHGVFVSGSTGTLRGIHFRDIVVHGVSGDPKTKEGGLLVIAPGSEHQRFEDVLIDGVAAYGTSQWAGILVGGVNHGFLPDRAWRRRRRHCAVSSESRL
jgi:hypothetical protein